MSSAPVITQDEVSAVYSKVAKAIADALAREVDECQLKSRIIDDLGAESIDLLDIVFRLERAFKIKIPRNRIASDARGDLPEAEFERKGIITEAGRKRLQEYLSEVPPESFPATLRVDDIPRLFTVETFCKLVARALAEQAATT
ncbi:MAG TPA: phosphopantetheine-binding protein [Candidatus Binataceae bacterium]|nr:phosphopantetheine-binding protein [Candidatus Binataceae bacterium]